MPGVFADLRVLDLSWGTAGPMTTMMLADAGADVVRIERPDGDPFAAQAGYRVWNRGKRSAVVDLADASGQESLRRLCTTADVVVHSFGPGVAARIGVDHSTIERINPRLISLVISGYPDHPDHREHVGYDGLVAARTGLLYDQKGRRGTPMEFLSGREGPLPEFDLPDGLVRGPDRPGPVFPRTMWPSVGATYLATLGVAAALRVREVTGLGQQVVTSLFAGALASVCLNWQRVENPDAELYWMWPADGRSIEGLYECADGRWVHHWTIRPSWVLTAAAGDDGLAPPDPDGEYRDDPDRMSMEPDGMLTGMFLHPQLVEAFAKYPSSDWIAAADETGMGVALVRSPAEALADEAFSRDGCVVTVEDPSLGPIRHCGPLVEFSRTPSAVVGPSPRPGQHTAEVLGEKAPEAVPSSPASAAPAAPLSGVRVIDLGLGVAGPFAGRMLADLGADVIKIHALYDGYWAGTHMGLGTNRGKRSIALNVKHPDGRRMLDDLIAGADVVTTNWRPGAAARLGLDYATLSAKNPRLVYCNSRGYEKGPRSLLPGTDQTAAALTGTEWEDGGCDHGNPPLWSRSNMGDTGNALLSAIGIVSALYDRERTGLGQEVSTSIVNAGLLHTSYAWIHADGRPGDWEKVDAGGHGLSEWYRLYECAEDTWLFVAAVQPHEQSALVDVLAQKPAAELFVGRTASEWRAELDSAGVPAEVVDESYCRMLVDDPVAYDIGIMSRTWAKGVGTFDDPGLLVRFSATPGVVQRGPAMCGEHTREILQELGYDDREIDRLVEAKAILDAPVDRPATNSAPPR